MAKENLDLQELDNECTQCWLLIYKMEIILIHIYFIRAGSVASLTSTQEAWGLIPSTRQGSVHTGNRSTWEVESGVSAVQGDPWLPGESRPARLKKWSR